MISVNTPIEENLHFRGKPSVTECLYDQSECNRNDLWRTNSLANVNKPPAVQMLPVNSQPKLATETASKFGHHRLW